MRIGGLFYKQVTLTSYLKVDAQWHHKRMSGVSLDRIHHLVDRWALGEVGLYYFKEVQWGSSGGFWVGFFSTAATSVVLHLLGVSHVPSGEGAQVARYEYPL